MSSLYWNTCRNSTRRLRTARKNLRCASGSFVFLNAAGALHQLQTMWKNHVCLCKRLPRILAKNHLYGDESSRYLCHSSFFSCFTQQIHLVQIQICQHCSHLIMLLIYSVVLEDSQRRFAVNLPKGLFSKDANVVSWLNHYHPGRHRARFEDGLKKTTKPKKLWEDRARCRHVLPFQST